MTLLRALGAYRRQRGRRIQPLAGSCDYRQRLKAGALEAVRRGAYGSLRNRFDAAELLHIVNQASRMRQLEIENRKLRAELPRPPGFYICWERVKSLETVLKQARSVAAATSATVLLSGENGTGKRCSRGPSTRRVLEQADHLSL